MDKRIEKLIKEAEEIKFGYYWASTFNPNLSTFMLIRPNSYFKLFRIIREKKWFSKQSLKSLEELIQSKIDDNFNLGIEIIKTKNNE